MSSFVAVLFALFFMREDDLKIVYVLAFLSGIGIATAFLVPWSMLPDVIDLDELRTGTRREGDMYSIFVLFQKIGLGIALSVSSWVLGWAGYVSL
jgi:GPH family glycoside/pentoside/hexuronide:cation symporter